MVLKRAEGAPLWTINADGTGLRQFYSSPEYTHCRTPAWSPDGKKVAFVAIRSLFGEAWSQSRLLIVDAAGGTPKELALGVVPSWTNDGKRIAFTGVAELLMGSCTINPDGSDPRQLDPIARSYVRVVAQTGRVRLFGTGQPVDVRR